MNHHTNNKDNINHKCNEFCEGGLSKVSSGVQFVHTRTNAVAWKKVKLRARPQTQGTRWGKLSAIMRYPKCLCSQNAVQTAQAFLA